MGNQVTMGKSVSFMGVFFRVYLLFEEAQKKIPPHCKGTFSARYGTI